MNNTTYNIEKLPNIGEEIKQYVMAPQDSKENKILSSKIKEEGKIIQKVRFKNMSCFRLQFLNNSHKISFYFFCNIPEFYFEPRLRFKHGI